MRRKRYILNPPRWLLYISKIAAVLRHVIFYLYFLNTFYIGPAVAIVDERNVSVSEAVFKNGALVRLMCLVRQAERDNFSLHWKLGSSILNHDTQRGGVR